MPFPRSCAYFGTSFAVPINKQHCAAGFNRNSPGNVRAKLTPRRREVLELVAMGRTSKEIAVILKISVKTVGFHRSGLMHELGIENIAALVRYSLSQSSIEKQMLNDPRASHEGSIACDAERNSPDKLPVKLTRRRREVLQLVATGKSSKEIAAILKISAKTVDFHRSGLMRELGMRNVADLVRYSVSEGVIRE